MFFANDNIIGEDETNGQDNGFQGENEDDLEDVSDDSNHGRTPKFNQVVKANFS